MRNLLLTTIFIFTAFLSVAQPHLGYNSTGVQFRMLTQMVNNRYWYRNTELLENNKYNFRVTFKDGTTKDIFSKIYTDTALHVSYLKLPNKKSSHNEGSREERIYPKQTLKISRLYENFKHPEKKETIEGLAADSCWLFKSISGKITAYSFLSERLDMHTGYLSAIQVDSGAILNFSPEQLRAVISNSDKAMRSFNKQDYYQAIIRYNAEIKKASAVKQ
ncbi:hypothetical protein [Desertivirga arenae]|uniref:hypothetical protein n=1 Tax=Desertivirga arenae TaxID=2810309 RepID=UPI001A966C09|nr:hypothetical protein [Pedobacter sp. SYSU D00823]